MAAGSSSSSSSSVNRFSPSPLVDRQVRTPKVPLVRDEASTNIKSNVPVLEISKVPAETEVHANVKVPVSPQQGLANANGPAVSQQGHTNAKVPTIALQLHVDAKTPPVPQFILHPTAFSADSLSAPVSPDETFGEFPDVDSQLFNNNANVRAMTFDSDEAFKSFYDKTSAISASQPDIRINVDDLDVVEMNSSQLIRPQQKVRPQRRKVVSTANPLRSLAARSNVNSILYEETKTGVAEKELNRIKREQVVGAGKLGDEALQALSSKEDLQGVVLRKTDITSPSPGLSNQWFPFKPLMLLQVKGRRPGQVRLVEPKAKSINSGDCFILVTPQDIFLWIGEFCNVIEKVKATEIANYIYQHKDLGAKNTLQVTTVHENKQDLTNGQKFWKALGGRADYRGAGAAEEDEVYENLITATNMVYRLGDERLHAVQECWGKALKHDILKSNEVMVFDFGSELYVWNGKDVTPDQRRLALRLAKEVWDHGYDYTGCEINPLSPLSDESDGLPLKSTNRPSWSLRAKVNEKMETVLFREKFVDWPDESRLLRTKRHPSSLTSNAIMDLLDIKVADVSNMLLIDETPVSFQLEGSEVGRGNMWVDTSDGLRREYEIVTLGVEVWHILEYNRFKLEEISRGQFHDGDTYVIRWHYMINQKVKGLKGKPDRQSVTGRERYAYFFWQGANSNATEQGTSALMAVELDEEKGPQVRINQSKEPPCFINLFGGHMIVHVGRREDDGAAAKNESHLYMVRNELPSEVYLTEVEPQVCNLRSRSSFLLINRRTGMWTVWHGCKAAKQVKQRAEEIAHSLQARCPPELRIRECAKITVSIIDEGLETNDFWSQLDCSNRSLYFSLLLDKTEWEHTPRLFNLNSLSGTFNASEILNPVRSENAVSAFPFLQSDMYSVTQPALFLLDNHNEVYVWQGWWPEGTSSSESNVVTGSAYSRFALDRLSTLKTALDYCNEKTLPTNKCLLVFAGLEPLTFTNLFPFWKIDEDAKRSNLMENKMDGDVLSVQELYNRLTQTKYTWQQLQERPLPEGVNPLKLEFYLEDSEFELMLGMGREEFSAMPVWKQNNIKREVGLF